VKISHEAGKRQTLEVQNLYSRPTGREVKCHRVNAEFFPIAENKY